MTHACHIGIESIWDLQRQSQIGYGTVASSSIEEFFRSQERQGGHYSNFYETMSMAENRVNNTAEGIQRVRNSHGKPKGMDVGVIIQGVSTCSSICLLF